jgi:cytochrome P450
MTTTESCPMSSIGERFNPLSEEQLEDPYSFYAEARREEPVFYSPAFHMWVVTRYADARAVLGNPQLFSSRKTIDPIVEIAPEAYAVLATGPVPVPVLVNSDPPDHGRFRRVLNRSFSPPRMRLLEPAIRDITNAGLDSIEPLGRADVMQAFAFPIPAQVITRLLGVGDEHAERLMWWGRSLIALISSALSTEQQVAAASDVANLQRFMADLVERKRAQPGDDIASQMLASGEDTFTDGELVFQLTGLLVAGHETTSYMIGNAIHLLLRQPERWRAVVGEPSLIPAAIEETLRIDSSVPTFIRTATEDTELAGRRIAKGENVLVAYASVNHDEEQFTDPATFDLHRTGNVHMGFGHGIHSCVGAPLARLEGRVILEALASRLPSLRLVPHQSLRHFPQIIFRGFERLDVEWDL